MTKLLHKWCLLLAAAFIWLPASQVSASTISNTARLAYTFEGQTTPLFLDSNTTTLQAASAPTPAVVSFLGYAPGAADSINTAADGGQCADAAGSYSPLPPTRTSDGNPLPNSASLPIHAVSVFHAGEPVFIQLADANRNTDSTLRDSIELVVTTSAGDEEQLRLQETGLDTGVFVGVIQSAVAPPAAIQRNCVLSVEHFGTISTRYVDSFFASDIAIANVLVDPYGIIFNTTTGAGINGITITLIDIATGLPATVFGDDGVSRFPGTLVTGQSVTDASGLVYTFPDGGFRFPFVTPGQYQLRVTVPPGFTIPSNLPASVLAGLRDSLGNPYAITAGSFGEIFTVLPGSPALNIDVPADPPSIVPGQSLIVEKQASRGEATVGDFVQYTVSVRNTAIVAAQAAVLNDVLPVGFRYRATSVRRDGQATAEPTITTDGRTLSFALGNIQPFGRAVITYVAELTVGARPGEAVNLAAARANNGQNSNQAKAMVRVREAFFGNCGIVVGRVVEGECAADWHDLKGVPSARVMLEDGTYTTTDRDGMYHFEKVCDGTHVVQLDLETINSELEATPCIQNTRFAGRSFSQFVDMQGGSLWRADFYTHRKPPLEGPVGIRLKGTLVPGAFAPMPERHTVNLHFDTRKAGLTPQVKAELDSLLAQLKSLDIAHLAVIGHTDNVRIAPEHRNEFADNTALSNARAHTAASYLQEQLGLASNLVSAEGRGEGQPIASNATAAGRTQNRRVEVVIQPRSRATAPAALTYRVEVDGGKVPVSNLRTVVMLPEGVVPKPGTAKLDGVAIADAKLADGTATFEVGNVGANWNKVIEFAATAPAASVCPTGGYAAQAIAFFATSLEAKGKTPPVTAALPCPAALAAQQQRLTEIVHFDSRKTAIAGASKAALDAMAAKASGQTVQSLSVVAHADGQRIAPENRKEFANNQVLSEARADAVKNYLDGSLQLDGALISLTGKSNTYPVASNKRPEGMAQNRRAEVVLQTTAPVAAAAPVASDSDYASTLVKGKNDSGKKKTIIDLAGRGRERAAIADDVTAAGGNTNWLDGQEPGSAWLFPAPGHNPRAPTTRVVVKHAAANKVRLTANGKPVEALAFDGTETNATKTMAVSIWHGIPLVEGDNRMTAEEVNAQGQVVNTLSQTVHFSNSPIKAEIVPEQSIAVADGITKPVIAVRFTDAAGKPVRAGVTGPYNLDPPFVSAETVRRQQERQLAGEDSFVPTYKVEGDNGIAYIELQPTTQSGYADIHLAFQQERGSSRRQDLRTWMASEARDWVVVGFAEGTVGYNTLNSKTQALAAGAKDELYNNGQVAFYAKGRVKGEWLLTMAYDTRKNTNGLRNESLQQIIDPDEYYLIYGDGSEQRYDAPSQKRLYLKLERGKFFALFGDYETGLTETKLSRYSRALNGIKSEYAGERFAYTAFASETAQNYVREEIQGNGTSGLYRLSRNRIVINSERISLVIHDRLRSELIVDAKSLFRHIDYDIDYSNGTIFFKSPVFSRDGSFNPQFIQAEYEVSSGGEKNLNAGGRAAVTTLGGKLTVGGSYIRDERDSGSTNLGGLDAKLKLGADTEVRLEAAQSDTSRNGGKQTGNAWTAEVEHHQAGYDVLAYARRQEQDFGVDQQSGFEAGTQKYGIAARAPLSEKLSVNTEGYRQENLTNSASRDVASARLEYSINTTGRVYLGGQYARDEDGSGRSAQSNLLNVGASDRFLGGKLELQERSDFALGGRDGNVSFPSRHTLQAGYDITAATKLIIAQEFTQGGSYDSSTTRVGAVSNPWKGARLNSTLNQSFGEYGPRTFAQYGLSQSFLIGKGWGFDIGLDRSETFNKSGKNPVVVDTNGFPLSAGGVTGGGNNAGGVGNTFVEVNTEDFTAVSAGATYRAELWSTALRAEYRDGEREDRQSISLSTLRQARSGVAMAAAARVFSGSNAAGTSGQYGNASLSLAYRPLGSRWSLLERLEYRHDAISSGSGIPGGGLFGSNTLNVSGNARSRAIINHLSFNRVSRHWTAEDRKGNLFTLNQRNQVSVFYGAKYTFDNYNGQEFTGFTDMLGLELRHDLTTSIDIGLQASLLHSWEADNYAYSVGPMVGISPVDNLWVTLGYNLSGFEDRDFDDAGYTAQGPYLKARWKFDQLTRFGQAAASPQALTPQQMAEQTRAGGGK